MGLRKKAKDKAKVVKEENQAPARPGGLPQRIRAGRV